MELSHYEFQNGWMQFAVDHELVNDNVVLLSYLGSLTFDAYVFSANGGCNSYPWSISNHNCSDVGVVLAKGLAESSAACLITSCLPHAFANGFSKHRFCKVLDANCRTIMLLPHFCAHWLENPQHHHVVLKTGNREWVLDVDIKDGCFSGDGWTEFAVAHLLECGQILVFCLTGDCDFKVLVFSSGVEEIFAWY